MNVSQGKHLEKLVKLVEQQVKTGIYQNSSEVVRDALRHLFVHDDADDTELLAQCLRQAKKSPRRPYSRGEFRKLAASEIAAMRNKIKAA